MQRQLSLIWHAGGGLRPDLSELTFLKSQENKEKGFNSFSKKKKNKNKTNTKNYPARTASGKPAPRCLSARFDSESAAGGLSGKGSRAGDGQTAIQPPVASTAH